VQQTTSIWATDYNKSENHLSNSTFNKRLRPSTTKFQMIMT